ncbi:MAG: GEVED domain-containing protein, partial [Chitinophagales bacterium]
TLNSSITIPATASLGNYKIRIGGSDYNHASGNHDPCYTGVFGAFEDYTLNVTPAPSCVQPTIDSTANLTQTSIDLHWTTGGATNWVVEYGAAGFLPGTGAGTEVPVATTASESLSGLTSSTAYEWYVRDFCGGTDSSAWAGPNSFYTGYCLPASSGSASYLDGFTTTNGTTNISNLATGFTTGGYADYFSAHSVSVPASLSFDFATTIVGGTLGTSIWIDWNNDLVFDASEKVFNTTTYQNDQTGTISVPITTPVGDYAMRVMVDWNASNPSNPCRQTSRMEAEDYKLTVLAVPPCANPNIDSVSNITQTSADLFWTTGGSSNWDIEWGASGFTQGSGTMISNTATNPYNLTGLSAATSYDFYVRDICASDTSVWDGPFTFLTLCPVAYAAPFCEGFEGGSINCWGNETATDQFDWTVNSGGTTSGGTGPSAANGGSQYVYTETSSPIVNGDIAILYSVAVDLTALTTPAIDFYYHMYGAGMDTDGTFSVDVSTDGTTWVNLFTKMGNQGNQWNNGYVEMPAYAGDTVIFRFSGIVSSAGTAYENDFALDDFCVIEALPCPGAPSDLSVSNVTAMAADLHWISNFSATDYVVEWDTFGFVQGTGFDFEVNTDTFTSITGLAAQTQYQFYVRDLCGVADSSNWAGPFTFETPCAVYTPDYMEDFTTFVPNCWEKYTDGTSLTGPTGPGSGSWFADGFANNGFSGAAKINIYGSTAQSDWLVSPTFDLSAGGYQLAFDVAGAEFGSSTLPAAMGSDDTLALMKSVDGGATWAYEKMWTQGSEPSLAGDRETFMLGTGANTVFAFYGNNGSTSGGDNDLFFDNFVICTPVINATPVDTSFCDGDSIVLANGNSVLTAGMYNDTLIAVSGCDSIFTYNVTVLMPSTSTVDTVVCQGTPLTLPGGTMVSSGGSYDEVYTNAAGCDSTVTYNVTMNVATSSSQDVHLCDGATFTLPLSGTVVSAANSYIETTPNAAGCDSVITYHVTTGASTSQTLNVSFCAGDSVMLADGTYASAAGTMMVTTTNASGCDDVITYNVTENAVATGSVTASICMGDSYMFDGNMLTTAGTYTMVTTGANSCDSTVTLTLTVNMPTSSSMNAAICMGNTYMFDGNALTTAGTYTMVTPGSNTCDSTVTLTLVVNASSSSSISASICNGDSYMFDGNALTTAGTYTANETNAAGCDSTTTLTLTVDMTADETRSESICNGDTYEFGTQMLTTAGTYTETFTNANGCTYDVTLTLAVNNATSTTEEVALCGDVTEYTLANGTVVTEAGVYTAITPNANGCDNIITYNVSTCVGIFDVENAIGMLAYPNPSVDVLNIEFSEKLSNNNSVMILNVLGQAVYSVENTSDLKLVINTSEFTSGVYYINVTSDNKTSVKSITVSK